MSIAIKKVTAGLLADRPTYGYPGQIYIVYISTAAPEVTMWDQIANAWVNLNPTEIAKLQTLIPTAGTATASKYMMPDANNLMNDASISGTDWTLGGITHTYEDTTIANAAVKTLNATPVDLTAAPGAANFIVFEGAMVWLDYAVAGFDGVGAGDDLSIIHETAGTIVGELEATGFGDAAADEHRWLRPAHPTGAVWDMDGTAILNKKLQAQILTGEWFAAAGGSALKFRTFYAIVPSTITGYVSETLV